MTAPKRERKGVDMGVSTQKPEHGKFDDLANTYGTPVLEWKADQRRIRFMFDDGTTVDVLTEQDDSHMRGALLDRLNKERIVGSTIIEVGPQ